MPRPLRIEFENAWHHVMNRGANQQAIFKSISHRNLFYTLLSEVADRFKLEIHAFCLMNNHYHLLVRTPLANLARTMQHLDGIYTQRFNKLTHRDGPLFRGRYKAILVDSDQYLLQVSRYIHLNPVAAKICTDPREYKWSSYRSFIDKRFSIAWLTTSSTLNQMTGTNKSISYESFVTQGIDNETTNFYKKKHLPSIYGSKKFVESHLNSLDDTYAQCVSPDINHTKLLPNKNDILGTVMNYFNISQSHLYESIKGKKNIPKLVSIYLLSHLGQLTHRDISNIFTSLSESSISTQIIRFKKLAATNSDIKKYVREILNALTSHG